MFVKLDNTVEGLIRLSDLTDDYYHYHELQHALIGERTSKIYRIGDAVKVRVARVNIDEHTVDFELVDIRPRANKVNVVDGSRKRSGKNGGKKERGRKGDASLSVSGGKTSAAGKRSRSAASRQAGAVAVKKRRK
jgi:ribonuclease R